MKKEKIRVIKEKEIMNKLKRENASVTLFVLIMCMFFIVMLLLVNIGLINKNSNQEKQIEQIGKMYSVEEADLEEAYELAIKGNTYPTLAEMEEMINQAKDEMKTEMENKVTQAKKDAILSSYPVGSIYITIDSKNPGETIGGKWEEYAKGQTLVGINTEDSDFNTIGKTGGSKTQKLTIEQLPAHTHTFTGTEVNTGNQSANHTHTVTLSSTGEHSHTFSNGGDALVINSTKNHSAMAAGYGYAYGSGGAAWFTAQTKNISSIAKGGKHTHTATVGNNSANHTHSVTAKGTNSSTGSGEAHNNLQPYIVTYMWKRTA